MKIWDIATDQHINVWKFRTEVSDFSYHPNGLLVFGFYDHSIECWQNIGDEKNYLWQLRWLTNIDKPRLFIEGLLDSNVIGLSDQNRRILEQCGAIVEAKYSVNSMPQSSPESHQPPTSA